MASADSQPPATCSSRPAIVWSPFPRPASGTATTLPRRPAGPARQGGRPRSGSGQIAGAQGQESVAELGGFVVLRGVGGVVEPDQLLAGCGQGVVVLL